MTGIDDLAHLAKVWADRMTNAERDQTFPDSMPRNAATLILIDRAAKQPKVLLGKRHQKHKFMPGKYVFPGGRIEAVDSQMSAASELDPAMAAKLVARPGEDGLPPPRAFPLAAIRETYEETGLMVGVKRAPPPAAPAGVWETFAQAGVHPDLSHIHFIARAITPPKRPKRFDARFFTADAQAIAHRIDAIAGPESELLDLQWVPLAEVRGLDMPTITGIVLEELAVRVKLGMGHDLPVPFYFMEGRQYYRELT